jgi:hypothetical protein
MPKNLLERRQSRPCEVEKRNNTFVKMAGLARDNGAKGARVKLCF